MRTVLGTGLIVALSAASACKKEEPPAEKAAREAAAALVAASKKVAETGKEVASAGAAAGMQGAAAGMQGAAQGMAGAAQGMAGMAEAMKQMGASMNGGKKVEPVNFRELKALLPEAVGSLTRKEAKGEKAGAMGIVMSNAQGDYKGDNGADLDIKITDAGSLSGPIGLGLASWASLEVDRETDTGYERTTTYGKHKAWEKYDSKREAGEIKVIVAGRFIVEVRGRKVKMEDMKGALEKLDLAKLEGMQGQGVQ